MKFRIYHGKTWWAWAYWANYVIYFCVPRCQLFLQKLLQTERQNVHLPVHLVFFSSSSSSAHRRHSSTAAVSDLLAYWNTSWPLSTTSLEPQRLLGTYPINAIASHSSTRAAHTISTPWRWALFLQARHLELVFPSSFSSRSSYVLLHAATPSIPPFTCCCL